MTVLVKGVSEPTPLLWLDLIRKKKAKRESGLPPVFPIVIHGGAETRNDTLTVQSQLASHAQAMLKFQPQNLARLVEERLIVNDKKI